MRTNIVRWVNPWLHSARLKLADANDRLAHYEIQIDGVKKTSSELYDDYARQIKAAIAQSEQLQSDLKMAQARIDQLVYDKQHILDAQNSSQNDQLKAIAQLNSELTDLRNQLVAKDSDMALMRKQLARLRVWILRTHKVDLASFMGVNPKEELVET